MNKKRNRTRFREILLVLGVVLALLFLRRWKKKPKNIPAKILSRKKVDEFLRQNYHIKEYKLKELRRFVKRESSSGLPKEVIIHGLVKEGWDKSVVTKFVESYHVPVKFRPELSKSKSLAWAISLILVFVFVSFGVLFIHLYVDSQQIVPSSAGMASEEVIREDTSTYEETPLLLKKETFKIGELYTYKIESDYIYKYAYITSTKGKTLKFSFLESGKEEWIKGSAALEIPITEDFSGGKNTLIVRTCSSFSSGRCLESKSVYEEFLVEKKEEVSKPTHGELTLEEKKDLAESYFKGRRSSSGSTGGSPAVSPYDYFYYYNNSGNPQTVYQITSDLNFDSNDIIVIEQGALLNITGTNLTFNNSKISAGNYQVFTGGGNISGSISNSQLNATWFGWIGDNYTNNTDSVLRLRAYLRQDSGRTIVFSPGVYNIKIPRILAGVTNTTLIGHGARFQNNVNYNANPNIEGTSAYSDDRTIQLNAYLEFFFNMNESEWFKDHAPYINYAYFGELINSTNASNNVTLKNLSKVSQFDAGDFAVVHGYNMMCGGFPPTNRYYEFRTIESVNSTTGVIVLDSALNHTYRDDWWENSSTWCKSQTRILSLNRETFNIADEFTIQGIEFLENPTYNSGDPGYDSAERANAGGARKINIINATYHSFVPSNLLYLNVTDSVFGVNDIISSAGTTDLGVENDKFGLQWEYHNSEFHNVFGGGSSLDKFIVTGSTFYGRVIPTARTSFFKNNVFNTITTDYGYVYGSPSYPVNELTFINNTFNTTNGSLISVMTPGVMISFTPEVIVNNTFITGMDLGLWGKLIKDQILFTINGTVTTIEAVYQYNTTHIAVQVSDNKTINTSDTLYASLTRNIIFTNNTLIGNGFLPLVKNNGVSYPYENLTINGISNMVNFTYYPYVGGTNRAAVFGRMSRVTVNVSHNNYPGTKTLILYVRNNDNTSRTYALIDLNQSGFREINQSTNSGEIGSDSLNETGNEFLRSLILQKGGTYDWNNVNATDMPNVTITVYYQNLADMAND